MISQSVYLKSIDDINWFLIKNNIADSQSLLITIFTSNYNTTEIKSIQDKISGLLPKSILVWTSTAWEICDWEVSDGKILINFTQFINTEIKSIFIEWSGHSVDQTIDLLTKWILKNNTKCIISFADWFNQLAEPVLKKISYDNDHLIIVWGKAGQDSTLNENKSFIFDKHKISSNAILAISLNSDSLIVNTEFDFNWQCVWKWFTVTKSDKNTLLELDWIPIKDIYEKYLWKNISQGLDWLMEFPLLLKRDWFTVARDVVWLEWDSMGLVLTWPVYKWEKMRFWCGNKESILNDSLKTYSEWYKYPKELTMVFSCVWRKKFLWEDIIKEIKHLEWEWTSIGFFTFSEFYWKDWKFEMLNLTSVLLYLSENNITGKRELPIGIANKSNKTDSLVTSLSKLLITTSNELIEVNEHLNERVSFEVKKHEKIQEEYLESHRNILKLMPDWIIITDSAGMIIYTNRNFTNVLWWNFSDIEWKPITDIMDWNTREKFYSEISWYIKLENKQFFGKFIDNSWELIPVEINVIPFVNNDYVIIIKDLKAIKKLIIQNEELKRISQMKDDFINTAGHELRSPLTAINGYLSMLSSGDFWELSKEVTSIIWTIYWSSKKLLALINDMLDLSKIESGQMNFDKRDINLKSFMEEIYKEYLLFWKDTHILFILESFNKDIIINSNKKQLSQAVWNLISNAIKFTPPNGKVTLYWIDLWNWKYRVGVKDTWIWISESDFWKIFTKFWQVDSPLSRVSSWTGLWLPLTQEILKRLGDIKLNLDSQLWQWSDFRFIIES